jgi:hypothetical protein
MGVPQVLSVPRNEKTLESLRGSARELFFRARRPKARRNWRIAHILNRGETWRKRIFFIGRIENCEV